MRSLIRIRRMSLWPVLTLACGLLAGNPACRGDDAPDGDSAAAGATAPPADNKVEKANDSQQKAIQDAQAAYEKEQRELKERLEKDPLWQPTHENVAVIKPGKGPIESFCRSKEGNLLICCGGEEPSLLAGLLGAKADSRHGGIAVFSPAGKKLAYWKMPLPPQAICLGNDEVIYVAGGGRIAKLDSSGKILAQADAPNARELPPLPEVKKEPKKEGPKDEAAQNDLPADILKAAKEKKVAAEAEAAQKAKREKVAELTKRLQEAQKEYVKAVTEGQKDLKPNDDASMQAFQEKLRGPMEKLQAAQQELQEATMTPEMRAAQAQAMRERMATVTGMAATDRDLFVCCASTKGFGYVVWRTDHNFAKPKKIVENLAGCCGQMDIQAHGGDLWVAHNSRHKVEHYSRDGKKLGSFGKTDRSSADGFGGCCEPKNLRFGPGDVLFACESGPPTCVKRFTLSGKFLGVSVVAPWNSGCVRVTTEYDPEHDRFFVLNSGDQQIHVFAKKPGAKATPETASLDAGKH